MFKKNLRKRHLTRQLLADLKESDRSRSVPDAPRRAEEPENLEPLQVGAPSLTGKKAAREGDGGDPGRTPDSPAARDTPRQARKRLRRRRFRYVMRFTAYTLVFLLFFGIGVSFHLLNTVLEELPDPQELMDYEPELGAKFLATDGTVIGERFEHKRELARIEEIPQMLKNAVVAIEDARFYDHQGVDFIGIARAFYHDVKERKFVQGGSTITQQVVKLVVIGNEKTIERKAKEALIALKTEMKYSKDEIMEIYLNQAWFGSNILGVKAAADVYFEKDLSELNIGECAMLAGMLKNASLYSPYRDYDKAIGRQRTVLMRMHELGYIGDEAYQQWRETPLELSDRGRRARQLVKTPYFQFWTEHVLTNTDNVVLEDFETQTLSEKELRTSGLVIRTTLDLELQEAAKEALRKGLSEVEQIIRKRSPAKDYRMNRAPTDGAEYFAIIQRRTEDGIKAKLPELPSEGLYSNTRLFDIPVDEAKTWHDDMDCLQEGMYVRVKAVQARGEFRFEVTTDPHVQGALVAMDPQTGRVLALQGGFSWFDSEFNRATQAYRQPGSGFKPILYSYALSLRPEELIEKHENHQMYLVSRDRLRQAADAARAYGAFTPATVLPGGPVRYGPWRGEYYEPSNHDPGYKDCTMRNALVESMNINAVRILDDPRIIMADFIDYAISLGFDSERMRNNANRALALGAAEVTPLEMATAYAAFANHGIHHPPHFVDRILDRDGNIIYEHTPADASRVLSEQDAFLIVSMMNGVITQPGGTGYRHIMNSPLSPYAGSLAGKTGTTNNSTDAWFTGMSPDVVCSVYVGYDEFKSLGAHMYGSRAALPAWMYFMESYINLKGAPGSFTVPAGMETAQICTVSGLLAREVCPDVRKEFFREGTVPTEKCLDHAPERLEGFEADWIPSLTLSSAVEPSRS